MPTMLLLTAGVVILIIAGRFLRRNKTSRQGSGWPRLLFSAAVGIFVLFILWLAMMVLVVGPSMRAM